jgi:hypothetical protein
MLSNLRATLARLGSGGLLAVFAVTWGLGRLTQLADDATARATAADEAAELAEARAAAAEDAAHDAETRIAAATEATLEAIRQARTAAPGTGAGIVDASAELAAALEAAELVPAQPGPRA